MTTHEQIAQEIASEERVRLERGERLLHPVKCARQGDLVLVRQEYEEDASHGEPTPAGGLVLAKGSHGEHRLICDMVTARKGVVTCHATGLLVHTDQPSARHATLVLEAGSTWECKQQRELGLDGIVQQVRD